MSPIPQTNFLVGTFFAVSYSKPALIMGQKSTWNCILILIYELLFSHFTMYFQDINVFWHYTYLNVTSERFWLHCGASKCLHFSCYLWFMNEFWYSFDFFSYEIFLEMEMFPFIFFFKITDPFFTEHVTFSNPCVTYILVSV